jgi:hypothetical protein
VGRLALAALLLPAAVAQAGPELESQRHDLELWTGLRTDDAELSLARLTARSEWRWRFGEDWRAELGVRLELADDDTGLGTVRTYAPASRPLIDEEHARLELDTVTVSRQRAGHQIVLGKQVVAWGVLDGLRVTDRFSPVRLRDFLLTEVRPERLSRWGARIRQRAAGGWFDLAVALDDTVNQLPNPGDAFSPLAPQSRAGLPAGATPPPLVVSDRGDVWNDATVGLRYSHDLDAGNVSLLVIDGPDTDPRFMPLADGTVRLDYPRRSLFGATFEASAGAFVWRAEMAHSPDQPVNRIGSAGLVGDRQPRTLAGVGMDWQGEGGLFFNAQLGIDHQKEGDSAAALVRPQTDWIGTVRLQKRLLQDTLTLRTEWIGSLVDGDGALRPSLEWAMNDTLRLGAGIDWLHGQRDELFGQFRDERRVWLRLKASF